MHIKYVSISTVKVTKISWEYESIGFSVHLSRSFSVGIFSFEVIIVVEMVASRALYGSGNHVIYLSYYLLPFSAAECPAYHGLCVAHLKPEVAMVSAVKHIRYCQIAHRCMSYRNMHEKKEAVYGHVWNICTSSIRTDCSTRLFVYLLTSIITNI